MKDLLCLAMIVKNEAPRILKTIDSVAGAVDRAFIYDTGSTDGTQQIIYDRCKELGILCLVVDGEFRDYSFARNFALEGAEIFSRFVLMLSAEEELQEGRKLRQFVESKLDAKDWGYSLTVHFGDDHYPHPRITRSGAGARYSGVTHEAITPPDGKDSVLGSDGWIFRRWDGSPEAQAARVARWKLDRELLEAERQKNPDNPRTRFYLAQTYQCLGLQKMAADTYAERVELGGWMPERFQAALCAGSQYRQVGELELAESYLTQAMKLAPTRAEVYVELALLWTLRARGAGDAAFEKALAHARVATKLRVPKYGVLFLHRPDYEWRPWAILAQLYEKAGQVGEAVMAARMALTFPEIPARDKAAAEQILAGF